MCENTEDRVDLGTIEVQIDQGSNWPIKRCELTKVELTKDRVDHKPDQITFFAVAVVDLTHVYL